MKTWICIQRGVQYYITTFHFLRVYVRLVGVPVSQATEQLVEALADVVYLRVEQRCRVDQD